MKKLVIDRNWWLRNEGDEAVQRSYLLRAHDGKMCCLGFLCLDLGVHPLDMLNIAMPEAICGTSYGLIPEWLRSSTSEVPLHAAQINDGTKKGHSEAAIVEIFKEWGYELEFIN